MTPGQPIDFWLCGPLRMRRGDYAAPLRATLLHEVLALLLLRANSAVTIAEIVRSIWPGEGVNHEKIRPYIHRLRDLLAEAELDCRIETLTRRYVLWVDPARVDVLRFGRLVVEAERADVDARRRLVEEALELCPSDELLNGFTRAWVHAAREEYRAQWRNAVLLRNQSLLDAGEHERLLAVLQRERAHQSTDQRIVADYLLALYRSGQEVQAREHARRLIEHLVASGKPVQPRLSRIVEAIEHRAGWLNRGPSRFEPAPIDLLPPPTGGLEGRQSEIRTMQDHAAKRDGVRVIGLYGAPGIGKTTLATAFAHRVKANYPGGVLFARLRFDADPADIDAVLESFLRTLGVSPDSIPVGREARVAQYRDLTRRRTMLVVLDNVRSSEDAATLLPTGPGSLAIVTSRERLTTLTARHGALALVLGPIGLPVFCRGLVLLRNAARSGLSVRPMMVTLIGYVIILDAAINSIGWGLDIFANHALITRTIFTAWGNLMDGGYFWHYNELWMGGAGAPGEKAWIIVGVLIVFPLRIAAADLTGGRDLEQTMTALSTLADATLSAAYEIAVGELPAGTPEPRLAVLALGKCGGGELNYVSDVDVIFVAATDADLPAATQVASRLINICGQVAWQVDAALRPEGNRGPLVRTLASHVAYYRRWARTWEFQALLKARPAAGDLALAREWIEALAPLVWRAAERPEAVEDVRAMRRKIIDNIPPRELEREIKRGPGGLRDIEFAVQLLQLVHGRVDETLRVRGTLPALRALVTGGYVGRADGEALLRGYRFLRTVEHRLQLQHLRRTHTVPAEPSALRWLAHALGYTARPGRDAVEAFRADWVGHATEVRRLHAKLLYRPLLEAVARVPAERLRMTPEAARERLEILGFADPAGALRHIQALTGGVTRTAAIQRTLLPVLLQEFADAPEPDRGLLNYRQVSDRLGSTPWYLRLLRDSGPVAQRLARTLALSRYVADLLARDPEALRLLADDTELTPPAVPVSQDRSRPCAPEPQSTPPPVGSPSSWPGPPQHRTPSGSRTRYCSKSSPVGNPNVPGSTRLAGSGSPSATRSSLISQSCATLTRWWSHRYAPVSRSARPWWSRSRWATSWIQTAASCATGVRSTNPGET